MRSLLSLPAFAFVVATSALLMSGGRVADAAFHCMRVSTPSDKCSIGDNNIQYVELRMNPGRTDAHLRARDPPL